MTQKTDKTLETTLTAADLRQLKKDKILIKKVFVTTLILKYGKQADRKKKKDGKN